MEVVPVRTTRATSASALTTTASPSRSRTNRSKKSSTSTATPSRRSRRRSSAMKVEMPSTAATDDGDGDSDAGDDYGPPHLDDYRDYGSPQEDPESKVIDIYYHPVKEEPEAELGDGDGDAVDVNGCYDFDPPKEEPELVATSDDTDDDGGPDIGYDCSHCGISLGSRKFKVAHELRCQVRRRQREFESKIVQLYHCGYCKSPFVNEDYKERHQQKWCRKRPVVKKKPSDNPYFACDKCEYVTKQKGNLKRHFLTHNKKNAEWLTCRQCPYKTVRKYCMSRHMEIHSNSFTYCCSICGKSFRTKVCFDTHLLKQHSDESDKVAKLITNKIYTCNICDKYRTVVKTNFNTHLTITHLKGAGRQKYECPRCPYSTFYKGHLTSHAQKHAKQKNYRCTVCKKQFSEKGQLDSHILYIHADNVDLMKMITSKVHRCELCSFKTVQKTKLRYHIHSKHS